jgi:hypothetical protein
VNISPPDLTLALPLLGALVPLIIIIIMLVVEHDLVLAAAARRKRRPTSSRELALNTRPRRAQNKQTPVAGHYATDAGAEHRVPVVSNREGARLLSRAERRERAELALSHLSCHISAARFGGIARATLARPHEGGGRPALRGRRHGAPRRGRRRRSTTEMTQESHSLACSRQFDKTTTRKPPTNTTARPYEAAGAGLRGPMVRTKPPPFIDNDTREESMEFQPVKCLVRV